MIHTDHFERRLIIMNHNWNLLPLLCGHSIGQRSMQQTKRRGGRLCFSIPSIHLCIIKDIFPLRISRSNKSLKRPTIGGDSSATHTAAFPTSGAAMNNTASMLSYCFSSHRGSAKKRGGGISFFFFLRLKIV